MCYAAEQTGEAETALPVYKAGVSLASWHLAADRRAVVHLLGQVPSEAVPWPRPRAWTTLNPVDGALVMLL